MPILNWTGKEKVINHHQEVPFRVLEHCYAYKNGEKTEEKSRSGNKIIHGDNLEALKALLPEYEGKIRCIYIDPPYNTGNEKWVYNDNVNDPKIKKWLGQVVGKESEDLSRHDKWLCMMYPRLKLLHKLLNDNGVIFISIDSNEVKYLRLICDEIFGERNFIQEIIWKNKYGPGAMTKGFGNVHEYILCYSKRTIESISDRLSQDEIKKYKNKDEKFEIRGGYITQPVATQSKDDRPNLVYPIYYNGHEILPDKQWIWAKERLYKALENNEIVVNQNNNKFSVRFKQYLKDEDGKIRTGKPISILTSPFNQDGTKEILSIFGKKMFNNPKPSELIKYLVSITINDNDDKNGIYLDSFAGSGTTAHAVLNLNKEDGGSRRFILVEMEDYAENITAERVKRVIKGYGNTEGTGGEFDFYELGCPLFKDDGFLNEEVSLEHIRNYVYYTETKEPLSRTQTCKKENRWFLGIHNHTAYYFYYEKDSVTILDTAFLKNIKAKAHQYLIYADKCLVDKDQMMKNSIIFKKIPRDITRF